MEITLTGFSGKISVIFLVVGAAKAADKWEYVSFVYYMNDDSFSLSYPDGKRDVWSEKEIKPPKEKVLSWQYKLTSFRERGLKASITALCKSYDLNFNPAKLHDAIYDVKMNYEIFRRQIWEIEI